MRDTNRTMTSSVILQEAERATPVEGARFWGCFALFAQRKNQVLVGFYVSLCFPTYIDSRIKPWVSMSRKDRMNFYASAPLGLYSVYAFAQ